MVLYYGVATVGTSPLKIKPRSCTPVIVININDAINMVAGMVTAQVVTISPATCQRTLFNRSAAPDPIKAVLMTCGVLTGMPKAEAASIRMDDAVCEASAFNGRMR